jgi:hypothetical protein
LEAEVATLIEEIVKLETENKSLAAKKSEAVVSIPQSIHDAKNELERVPKEKVPLDEKV